MNDANDLPPLTELPLGSLEFALWLDTATKDLCDGARLRIKSEVEQHFFSTCGAILQEGLSPEAAVSTALAALGDPARAKKRFRKMYLTEAEYRTAKGMTQTQGRAVQLCLALLFLLCAFSLVSKAPHISNRGDIAEVIGQILYILFWGAMTFRAVNGWRFPRFTIGLLLVCLPLGLWGVIIKWLSGGMDRTSDYEVWPLYMLPVVFVLIAFVFVREFFPVLRKLRHKHNRDIAGI